MSFIEELAKSLQEDLKNILNGTYNKKYNFCIGSGSSFNVYKNITWEEAKKIYSEMGIFYCTGNRVSKKESWNTLFEKYYCMESNSGYVSCFIFEIDNIVEDKKED